MIGRSREVKGVPFGGCGGPRKAPRGASKSASDWTEKEHVDWRNFDPADYWSILGVVYTQVRNHHIYMSCSSTF